MQPLSADEAQRLYEQKEEAEKVLSEQRLVEQERQQVRNEVLMRYNDGLRDVTAAVKQINEKVQWLSASLGSKFTVLDYEKSGTRSGLEAVERLTVQSKKLKVCMLICTVHAHIRISSSITQLSSLASIFMYLLTMEPELLTLAPSGYTATTLTLLASYWSYSLLLPELW